MRRAQNPDQGRIAFPQRGVSIEMLITRCKMRCMERGDYWDKSADFLKSIQDTPPGELSQKQKAWLHGLRSDLRFLGDP